MHGEDLNGPAPEAAALEAALSQCESHVQQLEESMNELKGGFASGADMREQRRASVESVLSECISLYEQLETVAGDALQCGVDHDVPGAMDVFNQANAAIDRVVTVRESCERAVLFWCIDQAFYLGQLGQEAVFSEKVQLLDRNQVQSVRDAAVKLDEGELHCPTGLCVVYSARRFCFSELVGQKHVS